MKLLTLFVFMNVLRGCVDDCMSYGSTVQNVYPYDKNNLFYLPIESSYKTCKQCYFSISVPSTNTFSIGLYDPFTPNVSIATTTSDLNLNTGFTTCDVGYCMIILNNAGTLNFITIQLLDSQSTEGSGYCVFNNSHCSSSGVVSTTMRSSVSSPRTTYSLNCKIR